MLLLLPLAAAATGTTVLFAGHAWNVRSGAGGPGPNRWSDAADAVWVDDAGALHLAIRHDADGWTSAEVWLDEPTTYGVHRFYVDSRFDTHDPNVVLGLFTYQDDTTEIDVELAKWGDPDGDTVWATVQPPTGDSQASWRPTLTGSYTTHSFDWQPGSVRFLSLHGHYAEPPDESYVIGDWTCTAAQVPGPDAAMPVHINLWLMSGRPPTDGQEVEVVIRDVDLPGDPVDTGTVDTGRTDTGPADTAPPTDTAPTDTSATDSAGTDTAPPDTDPHDSGGAPPPAKPDGCGCGGPGRAPGLVGFVLGAAVLSRRSRRSR